MTIACGLARTYEQLLLARFGVAIGEATLAAPAMSILSDYFPRERRATVLSVFAIGVYAGAGLANLIGGVLLVEASATRTVVWPIVGEIRDWQRVFVIVGLPGLLIAALVATVREPTRRETGQVDDGAAFELSDVLAYVRANRRTYLCHALGYALFALVNYGGAAWFPTMIMRRLLRSASRPIGTPSSVKKAANPSPYRTPICVSLTPRSRRMGATRSPRICRSTNDDALASVRIAATYHA
jgi:MFS family permease